MLGSRHRGGGLEHRPHPLEELPGAHRARFARQLEEKPARLDLTLGDEYVVLLGYFRGDEFIEEGRERPSGEAT